MKKIIPFIFLAGVAAAVAAGVLYARPLPSVELSPLNLANGEESGASSKPHREAPPGNIEYYNPQLDFSLFYPNNLTVKVSHDGGATTLRFEDIQTVQGFQIFIVPYTASQVTQTRFLQDEPSGVRNSPKDITIDGATAMSFYGSDIRLGETAEIWFIHGGYLYEVTALKKDAAWLASIMRTWEFLNK